jgi:prepilin-type N-terminal cleavage/methylation domain-containing protein
MFIAPGRNGLHRSGFTLLEITFAVAILAMMSMAIYRFVQSNLISMRISSEINAIDSSYDGLQQLLSAQWQALPAGDGKLIGEPFKFDNRSRDEVTWVSTAGPGLLTRYARGEYRVTMRMRPAKNNRNQMDIGLTRKPQAEDEGDETWFPLLPNVKSMQIRYFDPRLNSWVDRWTDTVTLPRLVRLVITRSNGAPWDAIIALGRTPL